MSDENMSRNVLPIPARPRTGRFADEAMQILKAEAATNLGKTFAKLGRNEPCPCNSGRKFKHCHGAGSEEEALFTSQTYR